MRKSLLNILSGSMVILWFVSCVMEDPVALDNSNYIEFGVSTMLEDDLITRTEYSGKDQNNNDISASSTYERIDWLPTDIIRVVCDQTSEKIADYQVVPGASGTNSTHKGYLKSIGKQLQWGGTGSHAFYALYPSELQNSAASIAITSSGATVGGTIPAVQEVTLSDHVFKSEMEYAYMYAVKSGVSEQMPVDLAFQPLVTTLELSLSLHPEDPISAKLVSATLSSDQSSSYLSGTFSASLTSNGLTALTTASVSDGSNQISITLPDGGVFLSTNQEEAYTLTFLTLPMAQTQMTLTLTFDDESSFVFPLKSLGNWISVPAGRKAYLSPRTLDYKLYSIEDITLSGSECLQGATKDITVTSFKSFRGEKTTVSWKAYVISPEDENTLIAPGDADWPSWLSMSAYSGTGSIDGETVSVIVDANPFVGTVTDVATGGNGAGMVSTLQSAQSVGEEDTPRDLSLYDIYGSAYPGNSSTITSIKRAGPHTANCYLVSAPGWYCLPLVYGNAIDADRGDASTMVNERAFLSKRATAYHNSNGYPITSPFILTDLGLDSSSDLDAVVVWQDVHSGKEIVKNTNLQIINAPPGAGVACKYIKFYIAPEDIIPGNVVIALRNTADANKILWSWHIWVSAIIHNTEDTDDFKIQHLLYRTAQSTDSPNAPLDILNCNLGWTPPLTFTPSSTMARSAKIIIVQDYGTASPVSFTVSQPVPAEYKGLYYSQTFYQWGRKDPFLPVNSSSNRCHTSDYYTIVANTSRVSYSNLSKTVASWIQQPYTFDTSTQSILTQSRYDLWNYNNSNNSATTNNTDALMVQYVGKTIYDPCPAGFSVPPGRAFTGFTSDGSNQTTSSNFRGQYIYYASSAALNAGFVFSPNGRTDNYSLTFRFDCYRNNTYGEISDMGYRGTSWLAVPYNTTSAYYFYIRLYYGSSTQYYVYPNSSGAQTLGLSIRPALEQELTVSDAYSSGQNADGHYDDYSGWEW